MTLAVPIAAVLALAISVAMPHPVSAQTVCNNTSGPVAGQSCQTLGSTQMSRDCTSILGCLLNQQNNLVWAQFMSTSSPGGVSGGCIVAVAPPTTFTSSYFQTEENWGNGCVAAGTQVNTDGVGMQGCQVMSAPGYICGPTNGAVQPYSCECVHQ